MAYKDLTPEQKKEYYRKYADRKNQRILNMSEEERLAYYLKEKQIKAKSQLKNYAKKYQKEKERIAANPEKYALKRKLYRENNKETIKEYEKQYRQNPIKKQARNAYLRSYDKTKKETDPCYKLKKLLRVRLYHALKKNLKTGSAVKDLGCSVQELKEHLEKQFKEGMTWENWGFGEDKWNIDHIIPLASVDLSDRNELIKVCHYTNLQPLWQLDNIIKSDNVVYEKCAIF